MARCTKLESTEINPDGISQVWGNINKPNKTKNEMFKIAEPFAFEICTAKDSVMTRHQNKLFTEQLFNINGTKTLGTDIFEICENSRKLYHQIVGISTRTPSQDDIQKWGELQKAGASNLLPTLENIETFLNASDLLRYTKGRTQGLDCDIAKKNFEISNEYWNTETIEFYKKARKAYTDYKRILMRQQNNHIREQ